MSKPILLLFGSGKNIGAHTVQTFKANGYRVAQTARSLQPDSSDEDSLSIALDLAKSNAVSNAFDTVRNRWGEPSVVIYNGAAAYAAHFPDKTESYLAIDTEDFAADLAVNTVSAFAAARESEISFKKLPSNRPRTFMYTGNMGNEGPFGPMLSLGLGKAASAYFIQCADSQHQDQGIRFFYVDERLENGTPMWTGLGGQAHADFFLSLAERKAGDVPWQATFVKDHGYKPFPHEFII